VTARSSRHGGVVVTGVPTDVVVVVGSDVLGLVDDVVLWLVLGVVSRTEVVLVVDVLVRGGVGRGMVVVTCGIAVEGVVTTSPRGPT
jgi:hypothetical protein